MDGIASSGQVVVSAAPRVTDHSPSGGAINGAVTAAGPGAAVVRTEPRVTDQSPSGGPAGDAAIAAGEPVFYATSPTPASAMPATSPELGAAMTGLANLVSQMQAVMAQLAAALGGPTTGSAAAPSAQTNDVADPAAGINPTDAQAGTAMAPDSIFANPIDGTTVAPRVVESFREMAMQIAEQQRALTASGAGDESPAAAAIDEAQQSYAGMSDMYIVINRHIGDVQPEVRAQVEQLLNQAADLIGQGVNVSDSMRAIAIDVLAAAGKLEPQAASGMKAVSSAIGQMRATGDRSTAELGRMAAYIDSTLMTGGVVIQELAAALEGVTEDAAASPDHPIWQQLDQLRTADVGEGSGATAPEVSGADVRAVRTAQILGDHDLPSGDIASPDAWQRMAALGEHMQPAANFASTEGALRTVWQMAGQHSGVNQAIRNAMPDAADIEQRAVTWGADARAAAARDLVTFIHDNRDRLAAAGVGQDVITSRMAAIAEQLANGSLLTADTHAFRVQLQHAMGDIDVKQGEQMLQQISNFGQGERAAMADAAQARTTLGQGGDATSLLQAMEGHRQQLNDQAMTIRTALKTIDENAASSGGAPGAADVDGETSGAPAAATITDEATGIMINTAGGGSAANDDVDIDAAAAAMSGVALPGDEFATTPKIMTM